MRSSAWVVALCGLLGACVAPVPPFQSTEIYNPTEAAFARLPGQRSISGQAFMRQQGGGVVTCAGSQVSLYPNTAFSRERITYLYGSVTEGHNPFYSGKVIPQLPSEPQRDSRTTTCDAQGNFRFEGVPPENYFIATVVSWLAGNARQGGSLMKAVTVGNDDLTNVLLTPR